MSCWNGIFIYGNESDVKVASCGQLTMRLLAQVYDEQIMYADKDNEVLAKVLFYHFSERRMKIFEQAPFNYVEHQPQVNVALSIDEKQVQRLVGQLVPTDPVITKAESIAIKIFNYLKKLLNVVDK